MKRMVFIFFSLTVIVFCLSLSATSVEAATYYVSPSGSDNNSGNSEASPWQTIGKVNSFPFAPGDQVLFQRGGSWNGSSRFGLTMTRSGTSGNPITIGAYGSGGAPILKNPRASGEEAHVITLQCSWVIVENLRFADTNQAGVFIALNSGNNTIRNNEITNTGVGVKIKGNNNLITGNYIHDLRLVVDTWGAIAFWVGASGNDMSYNRIVNAIAPTQHQSYSHDGGAIEFWAGEGSTRNVSNNNFHHNYVEHVKGMLEAGGSGLATDRIENNTIVYNVGYDISRLSWVHRYTTGGGFQATVRNLKIENNTLFEPQGSIGLNGDMIGFGGGASPTANEFILRNNIFYIDGDKPTQIVNSNYQGFTHENNLYFRRVNPRLGISLNPSEVQAQPLFVNAAAKDFHLQAGSPAINKGLSLGYTKDFDDRPVPYAGAVDIGAFEYQSGTPAATVTPALPPTSTPTSAPSLPGDLDRDGDIDIYDYNRLVSDFGKAGSPGFTPSDIDKNGKVDIYDYNVLVGNFGRR